VKLSHERRRKKQHERHLAKARLKIEISWLKKRDFMAKK
jgi:hypothetical protein